MTGTTDTATMAPMRKSVIVNANVERAFRVFTDEFDSWWPRTHHIGKSPRLCLRQSPSSLELANDWSGPSAPARQAHLGSTKTVP
jgi:hypothetical protein